MNKIDWLKRQREVVRLGPRVRSFNKCMCVCVCDDDD